MMPKMQPTASFACALLLLLAVATPARYAFHRENPMEKLSHVNHDQIDAIESMRPELAVIDRQPVITGDQLTGI